VELWGNIWARLKALPPYRADAMLAVVVAVWFTVEAFVLVDATAGQRAAIYALFLVEAVGVGLRRRAPVIGMVLVLGPYAALNAYPSSVVDNVFLPFFVILLAIYSVGANTEGRTLVVGGILAIALELTAIAFDDYEDSIGDYLFVVVVFGVGPLLVGRVIRHRSRLNRALREKTRQLDAERAARAREAVLEERTRIAGELHDVVAHALSAMVVQAGAARRLAERDPERARTAFASVEGTGREALTEIRRLLGVLRREDEEIALAPQPSLAHVSTLVNRAQTAGLPVELKIEGEAFPLPAGVDLTAYRVLQEALTAAADAGHAGRAEVLVRYGDGRLELEVRDDGSGADDERRLLGTRERVRLYGGELRSGRGAAGHFVWARLPVGGPA
jgi:signal transduction histidine kinase